MTSRLNDPKRLLLLAAAALSISAGPRAAQADVRLPRLFTDHMVLQREAPVNVWGWAEPGEEVTVGIAGQKATATADADGAWQVELKPLEVSESEELLVNGKNEIRVKDIAVGDVWICSGQSNMEWPLAASRDGDLAIASAHYPNIRLLRVDAIGVQEPLDDIDTRWRRCAPENVGQFSAVGYYFGRQLHNTLQVPIGLVDNSWGGSSCEAWIPTEKFEDKELYAPLLARWKEIESQHDEAAMRADYQAKLEKWRVERDEAEAAGKPVPRAPWVNHQLFGQGRPANLYNARVAPIAPFAFRGVIWYQGESNAGRAYQYRDMFPLMVETWREAFAQDKLPFYWVQLADFREETEGPVESDWAELREAQTMSLDRLPNSGEAVIIDIGEANDIHPRNKTDVGNRLARIALADEYGQNIPAHSPRPKDVSFADGKAVIELSNTDGRLVTYDGGAPTGFTIAGENREWKPAQAKILEGGKVEVWSDEVSAPVAVRYAWANNPEVNLYNAASLPVTPFRTDDWPGVTANAK